MSTTTKSPCYCQETSKTSASRDFQDTHFLQFIKDTRYVAEIYCSHTTRFPDPFLNTKIPMFSLATCINLSKTHGEEM